MRPLPLEAATYCVTAEAYCGARTTGVTVWADVEAMREAATLAGFVRYAVYALALAMVITTLPAGPVAVPVIAPVVALMLRPAGKPVAL